MRRGRVQAVVVANDTTSAASASLLDAFARGLEDDGLLHSLWWNGNAERTNVILGPHWELRCGEPVVRETIGGAGVFFPPGAFGQSHLALADRAVERIHQEAAGCAQVAELYAGCGAIGLGLLARGARVAFNESAPHGLDGLARGIEALGPEARARAEVVAGRAGDAVAMLRECDVAIVDPPRRGLDADLCAALAAEPPAKVLYLSCGAASLAADLRALVGSGRLRVSSLTPWAFFPFTEHVETLVVLERTQPG